MFGGTKGKGAKAAQVKKPKDSENIVKDNEGRKIITVVPPNASDDYLKNRLGINDSQVKEIRNISRNPDGNTREKSSTDGLIEGKVMAASLDKNVNASGNEEGEEDARSAVINDGSDEDTEDQICGTCKLTADGQLLLCEVSNKWTPNICLTKLDIGIFSDILCC